MRYALITTDNVITEIEGEWNLQVIQGHVGGYIEAVTMPKWGTMYVNEERKLNGLELNYVATVLARTYGRVGDDVIVGNAVVVGPGRGGEDGPLGDEFFAMLKRSIDESNNWS